MIAASGTRGSPQEPMQAEYWSARHGMRSDLDAGERYAVLIPGRAGYLEATSVSPRGEGRRASLREPFVGLMAPRARLLLSSPVPADAVVLSVERARVERRLDRAALSLEARRGFCEVPDAALQRVGALLLAGFRARRPPPAAFLAALADEVAGLIAQAYAGAELARPGKLAPHRLERVHRFVEERLGHPVRIADLAAAANLSPFHFMRMFREATGESPHAYLTARRMERAKALLAQTGMPIAQVAYAVGYQTQAHFTGVFHKQVGMTPRAYRVAAEDDQAREVR